MPIKDFILQGFTAKTHTEAIRRIFDIPNIQQVILSVAFINEDGVRLIENELKEAGNRAKIFSGIRNDITSRQGLARLLSLGVLVHAVDTGARNIIFHPKLYLAKGASSARLVIGSANLTLGGLNNNIEAGLIVDLDLNDPEERLFIENIENQFLDLPIRDPEHIFLVKTEKELEDLQASGRLLDESEVLPPRPAVKSSQPSKDSISRIKLDVEALRPTIRRLRAKSAIKKEIKEELAKELTVINPQLLWQSKPLTERDLTIPEAEGTHPTGSINLDKGLLDAEVDHRHYFRDEVFNELEWEPSSPTVEEAEARFQLVVKGISYGEFTLRIGHTTNTSVVAYQQRNAMTRLSWGPAREYIASRDYIGRTLSLYRSETKPIQYILEID